MKNDEKRIIWQDVFFEDEAMWEDAYKDYLDINNIDPNDYSLTAFMDDEASANYDAEKENLDCLMPEGIVIIASLGLWNGRRECVSRHELTNLNDCLCSHVSGMTYCKLYVQDDELMMDEVHHDGTNVYRFRKWKDGVTADEKADAVESNDVAKVEALTESLTPIVRRIYGW